MKSALLAVVAFAASSAMAQEPVLPTSAPSPDWLNAPRDWSASLRQDAIALHETIIDNHPGAHDSRNPEFRGRADAGLALALQRAETTTDAGGWLWAMRALVAGFDDGHVQFSTNSQFSGFPTRWPGFLTVYRGEDQVVATRDETDVSAPPMGARLINCDGVPAAQLAETRIGAFRGRWFLESQRSQFGDWLFMSPSNPWLGEMETCQFESEGETKVWPLNWRTIEPADLLARRTGLLQAGGATFGLTTLENGGVWMSMRSFNGNPASDPYKALTPMMAEWRARQAEVRAAPFVVLDLRGNRGGSSHWGEEVAVTLWGRDWVNAHRPSAVEAIEWRASEGNIAAVQAYVDQLAAAGENVLRVRGAQRVVAGMEAARSTGQPYWREGESGPARRSTRRAPPLRVRGPVYVVTDAVCVSSCLHALDLWKALGAIQIGRETSADTVYMEVRSIDLPSELASLVIPMKVWHGRPRGHNEPHRPTHRFDGNITDSAALQAWVRTLN